MKASKFFMLKRKWAEDAELRAVEAPATKTEISTVEEVVQEKSMPTPEEVVVEPKKSPVVKKKA